MAYCSSLLLSCIIICSLPFPWFVPIKEHRYLRAASLQDGYDICQTLFNFSQRLLVGLNATQECCLSNSSDCKQHNSTNETMNKAKGEGWHIHIIMYIQVQYISHNPANSSFTPLAAKCLNQQLLSYWVEFLLPYILLVTIIGHTYSTDLSPSLMQCNFAILNFDEALLGQTNVGLFSLNFVLSRMTDIHYRIV